MGYTTEFEGALELSKPLTEEQLNYINTFSGTRRMKRDVKTLHELYNGKYGLPNVDDPYGIEGEFFARDDGNYGQSNCSSIIDFNQPSSTQPELWCKWIVEGNTLKWNGWEKFYCYTEWLLYLITNFFTPWGVILNGEILWQGEELSDRGIITVINSKVKVQSAPGW